MVEPRWDNLASHIRKITRREIPMRWGKFYTALRLAPEPLQEGADMVTGGGFFRMSDPHQRFRFALMAEGSEAYELDPCWVPIWLTAKVKSAEVWHPQGQDQRIVLELEIVSNTPPGIKHTTVEIDFDQHGINTDLPGGLFLDESVDWDFVDFRRWPEKMGEELKDVDDDAPVNFTLHQSKLICEACRQGNSIPADHARALGEALKSNRAISFLHTCEHCHRDGKVEIHP